MDAPYVCVIFIYVILFLAFEFELERSSKLGDLRQNVAENDSEDTNVEDVRLFHHSEKLRELIRKKEKPADPSILTTEGQIIEVSDDEPLTNIFGEVDIIKVDYETEVYSEINVECIGKDRSFLDRKSTLKFEEVKADAGKTTISFGGSLVSYVSISTKYFSNIFPQIFWSILDLQ